MVIVAAAAAEDVNSATLEFASRAAISSDFARNAADGSVPQPMRELRGPFAGCARVAGMKAVRAATRVERRTMMS
jgi:hypothetical protein